MRDGGGHHNTYINIGQANATTAETSRKRLIVIWVVFAVCFFIISLRVLDLSFENAEKIASNDIEDEASQQVYRRSDIVDRNGVILATSLVTASLYANPKVMLDKPQALQKLSSALADVDKADLRAKLDGDKSFVWIKRNLTPSEQYKVNALGIPGVYFRDEEKRIYPHKNLFAHTLGFVNIDGHGIAGVEKQFDSYLLKKASDANYADEPLALSVDVRVQNVVREALLDSITNYKAKGGSGIVMDVTTGEIIAMVSLPDFDPNQPTASKPDELFNRATYGTYEMGSVFKTFTMAMAMNSNKIQMKDTYDVATPIKIGGFTIHDYHPKASTLTIPEIFMYSSNIGSAKIALDVGVQTQKDFLKKIGLLSELPLELPEKSSPQIPQTWSKITSMTVAYGHGIAVTPMHIASATSSLVNGGLLYPVTLLKKDGTEIYGQRVVNTKTSDNIRKLLRFVVQYGTGGKANVASYMVGGKTGSADKVVAGGYNRGAIISSFVGAFPMNKPKYIVFAMLDEPVGNKSTGGFATGGMIAAPVVNKIISRVGPILNVMPVDENQYAIRKEFWYDNGTNPEPQLVSSEDY
jgi:cell division protein FtsI (penicillin-binding protein 3)